MDSNLNIKLESGGRGENKIKINKMYEDNGEKKSSFKQNFSLNDNYAESQEEGEEVEIQNIPINNYAAEKKDEKKNDNYFVQNLSKENVALMEKEENYNNLSQKFESDCEKEEKRNKDDIDKKECHPKKFFSLNDNNAQSEEGEEVENGNDLIQNVSIQNYAARSEKKEIIKNNPIVFLDEKIEIINKNEGEKDIVSPKKANNTSIYEQVNSLLNRKKSKKKHFIYKVNLLNFSSS